MTEIHDEIIGIIVDLDLNIKAINYIQVFKKIFREEVQCKKLGLRLFEWKRENNRWLKFKRLLKLDKLLILKTKVFGQNMYFLKII